MSTTFASGMEAFGKPVPMFRRSAALTHLRDMVPDITLDAAMQLIDGMASRIERDDPYEALHFATGEAWPRSEGHGPSEPIDPRSFTLDTTGGYRLLAVLCAAKEPVDA